MIIIWFALLKVDIGTVIAKKEILAIAFLFTYLEAMFAYDRFEIRDKFLIAMIYSLIKVMYYVDVSATFQISLTILWLVDPYLIFSIKVDEA